MYFIFVVLLVIPVSQAQNHTIGTQAHHYIDLLQETVIKKIYEGISTIIAEDNNFKIITHVLLKNGKRALQRVLIFAKHKVNFVEEEAKKLKLDSSECTSNNQRRLFRKIAYSSYNKFKKCINATTVQLKELFDKATEEINVPRSAVIKLATELLGCAGITGVVCRTRVLAYTVHKLSILPKQIKAILESYKTDLQKIQEERLKCKRYVAKGIGNIKRIATKSVRCLEYKVITKGRQ